MSETTTCLECRGEGKVPGEAAVRQKEREQRADKLRRVRRAINYFLPSLAAPFVLPCILYIMARFPIWMLNAPIVGGPGEAVLWFATILGSAAGVFLAICGIGTWAELK